MLIVAGFYRTLRKNRRYPDYVLEGLLNPDSEKINSDLIVELLRHISKLKTGAVLIFVPGWEDINSVMKKMNDTGCFPPSE